MRGRFGHSLQLSAAAVLAACANLAFPSGASAHVKWFCAFNVAGQPRGLENVLCPDFELLTLWALTALLFGYLVECSAVGIALLRALNRVTEGLRANTDLLIRMVCAFFFIAIWSKGGIILTPELKTSMEWVSWLQLAIAIGLIWKRTTPFSALGIVVLYALAVREYGIFHLLDYPIFLGLAAFLALTALDRDFFGIRPLDLLRWAISVTLMWASIEKWAYPQWSFPLFTSDPSLTMGFDREFFMRAAGMVEFALSFALLLTPLVRRSAALILCGMFLAAVPEFGKIDAIGHAPIVAALLGIIGDDVASYRFFFARPAAVTEAAPAGGLRKWNLALFPLGYCVSLAVFLVFYYVLHMELFRTTLT